MFRRTTISPFTCKQIEHKKLFSTLFEINDMIEITS